MKRVLPLILLPLLSGCVYVRHEGAGTTTTYIAPAFGTKSIASADLQKGVLTGYRSEQTQMAEAIAAGVSAGLTKGVK